jgi:catechol 2,3-dioxygenase-like lactoylglutathione lyase family enzyme
VAFAAGKRGLLKGRPLMDLWYRVSDLDAARAFYTQQLGFEQVYADEDGRWIRLHRNGVDLALAEGDFGGEAAGDDVIASLDVADLKAEADRLREAGVQVGVVVEIPGTIRILDVFDPDGNRIQLSEEI